MGCYMLLFVFKQKTAYEMRISDWSSDVCSSDLFQAGITKHRCHDGISRQPPRCQQLCRGADVRSGRIADVQALAMGQSTPPLFSFIIADADTHIHQRRIPVRRNRAITDALEFMPGVEHRFSGQRPRVRSEEHTSELQSLMRISS